MITILSERHAGLVLRHLRERIGLTRRELGKRLFVSGPTVANRERGDRGIATDALLDQAHALGFLVALVPNRRPGCRETGTGWPA